jgi:hypothetical protein
VDFGLASHGGSSYGVGNTCSLGTSSPGNFGAARFGPASAGSANMILRVFFSVYFCTAESANLGLLWEVKADFMAQIRASSLSGECRWTREFFTRNNFTITQQHQNCVRTRAVRSVMARPSCKDDVQAVKVVNEVWDSCFADTRPFDEIYR